MLTFPFQTGTSGGGADALEVNTTQNGREGGVSLSNTQLGDSLQGPAMPAWLRECTTRTWSQLEKENYFGQFTGAYWTIDEMTGNGLDPDEEWWAVLCRPTDDSIAVTPQIMLTGVLATWPAGDPLPAIINDWLVAYARALIEIPIQPGTTSPAGDVDAPAIAQLETWLWVPEAVWATQSATTPPVFGVTATVTAVPYQVEYETSEGDYVDCGANVGVPYDLSRPASAQSTDCSVVFNDASSVADQTLTSTVRWAVTWACSSSCGSGQLPDFVITNTRDVRVAELLGVGTSIGSGD
jgi:hypothetical protein